MDPVPVTWLVGKQPISTTYKGCQTRGIEQITTPQPSAALWYSPSPLLSVPPPSVACVTIGDQSSSSSDGELSSDEPEDDSDCEVAGNKRKWSSGKSTSPAAASKKNSSSNKGKQQCDSSEGESDDDSDDDDLKKGKDKGSNKKKFGKGGGFRRPKYSWFKMQKMLQEGGAEQVRGMCDLENLINV